MAEVLPDAFPDWRCEVVALEVERTFWEKAAILHTEYHRPADKATPDRFSRHYADTAALANILPQVKRLTSTTSATELWSGKPVFQDFVGELQHAKPGTFRLVPPPETLPALQRDYQAMRDMYLSEPVTFDEILMTLADLETRINKASSE